MNADAAIDNLAELLFAAGLHDLQLEHVFLGVSLDKAEILRNLLVENQAAGSRIDQTGNGLAVDLLAHAYLNRCVNLNHALIIRHQRLVGIAENLARAALGIAVDGEVVGTENHIL